MLLYSLYPSFYCVYKNKMVSGNAFTERERERELLEILFSFDTIISCSAQHTIVYQYNKHTHTDIPTFSMPQEFSRSVIGKKESIKWRK